MLRQASDSQFRECSQKFRVLCNIVDTASAHHSPKLKVGGGALSLDTIGNYLSSFRDQILLLPQHSSFAVLSMEYSNEQKYGSKACVRALKQHNDNRTLNAWDSSIRVPNQRTGFFPCDPKCFHFGKVLQLKYRLLNNT